LGFKFAGNIFYVSNGKQSGAGTNLLQKISSRIGNSDNLKIFPVSGGGIFKNKTSLFIVL
jgi:hypothetical protein